MCSKYESLSCNNEKQDLGRYMLFEYNKHKIINDEYFMKRYNLSHIYKLDTKNLYNIALSLQ